MLGENLAIRVRTGNEVAGRTVQLVNVLLGASTSTRKQRANVEQLTQRSESDIAQRSGTDITQPSETDIGTVSTENALPRPPVQYVEATPANRIVRELRSNPRIASRFAAIMGVLVVILLGVTVDARLDARNVRESAKA